MSLNLVHGEVYLIQHYVIKFVSDLRQVSGFLEVFGFSPPINTITLTPVTEVKMIMSPINTITLTPVTEVM